jgi:hypothetical protein
MSIKGTLTTIAVAAALIAPVASATWTSFGSFEPDTVHDDSNLMWTTPPGTITNRVYFNVYVQYGEGGTNGGIVNPNVGMLQTRLDPAGDRTFEAMFGIWTDCNEDGYVGLAESAVREYDSRVLLGAEDVCPPTTLSQQNLPTKWNGANNYGGWVTELIPIAGHRTSDLRVFVDEGAMVWGDPGLPDASFNVPAPSGCSPGLGPAPVQNKENRDNGYTVGHLLWERDCRGAGTIRGEPVSIIATWDATLGLAGLGWGSDPANSSAPQNRNLGSDNAEHSAFSVQDCDADPLFTTGEAPPGDTYDNRTIQPLPANPVNGDPNAWSIPATVNRTNEEQVLTKRHDRPVGEQSGCNYDDDAGQDFYGGIENNPDIGAQDGKNRASWNFAFGAAAQRGSVPASAVRSGSGAGAPTDLGVEPVNAGCSSSVCTMSGWVGPAFIYAPPVTRGDVAQGTAELAHANYYTFYAKWNATNKPGFIAPPNGGVNPGGSDIYGSDQCGLNTDTNPGRDDGWNCDRADWYLQADGTYERPQQSNFSYVNHYARVGDTYQFRDVDCYDGDLGPTVGLGTSPAYYGTRPCEGYVE